MKERLLIVGSSHGIGKKIREISSDEYEVINISRTPVNDLSESYELDVLKDDLPDLTNINHIIYCPGSINLKPLRLLTLEDFRTDFDINVLGAIKTIKAYEKSFATSENLTITLFSTIAVGTGMSYHSSVAAAKGAIEGITRSLAAEYAPKIRVNAIAPSLTDTPLASRILKNDKARENLAEKHPLKRILSPSDIAEMAHFIISKKAKNITGQIFKVDAGMADLKP